MGITFISNNQFNTRIRATLLLHCMVPETLSSVVDSGNPASLNLLE